MRVFLDANILFSAAFTDGAIRALLTLLLEKGHTCCVDAIALEEARRNLVVHRPDALTTLEHVLSQCECADELPTGMAQPLSVDLPEGDLHILRASIVLKCDILLTGDKRHFGDLFDTDIHGTTVVSPAQLYRRI